MASILAKLEIHSQMQALVFALRHGIVEILEIFLESPRIGGIGCLGNKDQRTSGVEPNLLGYSLCERAT
jgi:hypothetical protein